MPNFIFNPETFVTPGHGSDPGEWNDDDRKVSVPQINQSLHK